ncbi:MAG: YidB family protein [Acetobacter sp.]|uniref:YidB family protein n=1 Tax=unclassified Acetobacter TaxID=2628570 RepID=UPI0025BC0DD1|nr:YidB family protein [Acetobacter sp. UBA5411]
MSVFDNLVDKVSSALGVDLHEKLSGQIQTLLQPEMIQNIVAKADEAGLGDKVRSWIGKGDNLPVTPDEIRQILGNSEVQALVSRTGLPAETLLPALSHFLPQAVDKKTPEGEA